MDSNGSLGPVECIVCKNKLERRFLVENKYCSFRCRNYDRSGITIRFGIIVIVVVILDVYFSTNGIIAFLLGIGWILKGQSDSNLRINLLQYQRKRVESRSVNFDQYYSYQPVGPLTQITPRVNFSLEVSLDACCYQTTRLEETYCPCGKSIPPQITGQINAKQIGPKTNFSYS